MKEVFAMWKNTKMIILVALTAAIFTAMLIPFKAIVLIPGVAEVRPASMIPVTFGLLFGPAGAWGTAIGNMLGDVFGGTFAAGSLFGFVGNFFLAYIPYKLWANLGVLEHGNNEADLKSSRKILMYILIALLASAASGLIVGWGVDLLGIAPFSIIGTIAFANNSIATCTLGLVLTKLLFPRIKKWDLYWVDIMSENLPKNPTLLGRLGAYITIASIVICFPISLYFAYSIGGAQVPIVMSVAGIGSLGCLLGGILMN